MTLPDNIAHHVVDDAGCLLWQRACCNGHPCMRVAKKTMLVRRVLWQAQHGCIPPGHVVRTTCGHKLCVNPDHMVCVSHKALCRDNGAAGKMSGVARSAAIARAKRCGRQAKLSDAAVADIRAGGDTARQAAERYGVSHSHIIKIRKGKAWRDFSSPWLGLMAS